MQRYSVVVMRMRAGPHAGDSVRVTGPCPNGTHVHIELLNGQLRIAKISDMEPDPDFDGPHICDAETGRPCSQCGRL